MATNEVEQFWREYGEKVGEEILSYSLGKYLGGYGDMEPNLWGLLIATSGGFRFHHFPHEGWLEAMTRFTRGREAPKERTIFIARENILEARLVREKRLIRRLLFASPPLLRLRYRDGEGLEQELVAEAEGKSDRVVESLSALIN